jgi:hypothetical protein
MSYQVYGIADATRVESHNCMVCYIDKNNQIYERYTYKDSSGNWDEVIYKRGEKKPIYGSAINGGPYWNARNEEGIYPDFSKMRKIPKEEYQQAKEFKY